jgi:hypothetical protein
MPAADPAAPQREVRAPEERGLRGPGRLLPLRPPLRAGPDREARERLPRKARRPLFGSHEAPVRGRGGAVLPRLCVARVQGALESQGGASAVYGGEAGDAGEHRPERAAAVRPAPRQRGSARR